MLLKRKKKKKKKGGQVRSIVLYKICNTMFDSVFDKMLVKRGSYLKGEMFCKWNYSCVKRLHTDPVGGGTTAGLIK